jgi:hypothetical protein
VLNAFRASGFIDTRVLAESEARCQVQLSLVQHGIQAHCKKSAMATVISEPKQRTTLN